MDSVTCKRSTQAQKKLFIFASARILSPKHVQSFQMLVNKYRKRYFCHHYTSVPKFENLDIAYHKTAPVH
jgi:hypothetical protein